METSIESTIEKLETKIDDEVTLEKIQEKQEEITEYLSQVQEKIEGEDSRSEVKALVQEAKKVVVLKVVSGVTEYEDITQNISKDIASTPLQQEQAQEALQDTLETKNNDTRIIVRSTYTAQKVQDTFRSFDSEIGINFLYEEAGKNYFEILIKETSIFKQEMLPDIEQGILPESFIGIEVILPEIFSLSDISLSGENITQTWGIEQYKSYEYFSDISQNTQKIKIAVIDTGVDAKHPDLQGKVSA